MRVVELLLAQGNGSQQLRIKASLRAQVAKDKLNIPHARYKAPQKQILLQIIRFNLLRSLKLGNTEGLLSNQTSLGTRLLPGSGPPDAPVMVPRHRHRGAVLPLAGQWYAHRRRHREQHAPCLYPQVDMQHSGRNRRQPSGSRAGCDAESTVRACSPF